MFQHVCAPGSLVLSACIHLELIAIQGVQTDICISLLDYLQGEYETGFRITFYLYFFIWNIQAVCKQPPSSCFVFTPYL